MAKINWEKLEAEYITTKTTYRKIAADHKISKGSVEKYAKEHKWVLKRRQYWDKIKTNVIARTRTHEEDKLLKLKETADDMAEKMAEIMQDTDQFQRVTVQTIDKNGKVHVENKVVKKYDTKAIKNMTSALRELTYTIRNLYNIFPEDKAEEDETLGVIEIAAVEGEEHEDMDTTTKTENIPI